MSFDCSVTPANHTHTLADKQGSHGRMMTFTLESQRVDVSGFLPVSVCTAVQLETHSRGEKQQQRDRCTNQVTETADRAGSKVRLSTGELRRHCRWVGPGSVVPPDWLPTLGCPEGSSEDQWSSSADHWCVVETSGAPVSGCNVCNDFLPLLLLLLCIWDVQTVTSGPEGQTVTSGPVGHRFHGSS